MDIQTKFDKEEPSFFATAPDSDKEIWTKASKGTTLESFGASTYTSVLHKKGKALGMWVSRKYYLCGDTLIYCSKETAVKGFVKLDFVRCKFNPNAKKKRYSFTLQRNNASIHLYTDDAEVFEEWQKYLRPRVILEDFNDKYKTEKMIGKGSYGKVFLVRETPGGAKASALKESILKPIEGKRFAAKAIEKEKLKGKSKEMLINEIKIMRQLSHDNVIKLFEVHELPNTIYFIMNIVEGGELMEQMKAKGCYSEAECAKILKKLLEVLQYIQNKRILHRDLKPENILLFDKNDTSSVVIADFGLSCSMDDVKLLTMRCGTPGHVAPEILNNKVVDNLDKIDVFSLGCIFHKLLTGNSPFFATSVKEIIKLNKDCKINYGSFVLNHVSAPAKSLLEKMLEKEPANRISVKDALEHDFFTLPAHELEENIIDLEKKITLHDSKVNANSLKEKSNSGIYLKMSLPSMGSFYACNTPIMRGQVGTFHDENEDGSNSPGKIASKSKMSAFTNSDGQSPSKGGFPHLSFSKTTSELMGKRNAGGGYTASPLHRLALTNNIKTSDQSPSGRSRFDMSPGSGRSDFSAGGFSDYIETFKKRGFEESAGDSSPENFSVLEERP